MLAKVAAETTYCVFLYDLRLVPDLLVQKRAHMMKWSSGRG